MAENNNIPVSIKGKITRIDNTQNISDNFQKRLFEITQEGDYANTFECEFIKDKCSILDSYRVGQYVNLEANLIGRNWTNQQGKTMNFKTIQAWKIELQKEYSNNPDVDDAPTFADDNDDSLPF